MSTNEAKAAEPKAGDAKSAPESEFPVPEPAEAEVLSLRQQLAKTESQRDDLLRTLADYENSRKRSARDLELERKFAHIKLAADLLPAFDNLDRAVAAAKQAGDKGPLVQGVLATQAQLLDILKRHGITAMDAQGKPFDPNLHQAVQMLPSKDQPPNTVLQVLQQGFLVHDRVLRPASVIIAAAPEK
jgi:molecular chaperone GrpE